jgi:hypothetical protein
LRLIATALINDMNNVKGMAMAEEAPAARVMEYDVVIVGGGRPVCPPRSG